MWHEQRRMEKDVRKMQIDLNKRAERRKHFYENIRRDPSQFMQIHGRQCTIHTEKSIARAAEDSVLHKWQGDPEVLIDRFDVRSHLDHIPIVSKSKTELDSNEEREEMVCDFERFRIVIMNECRKIPETTYLRRIAEKEFWMVDNPKGQSQKKEELEKKKKSAETKSTIHFSYDDSEVVPGREENKDNEEEEEEEEEELEDLDAEIDIAKLDPEAIRKANKWGEMFGIRRGLFISLLKADQQATKDALELRKIERQKIALAGREGKAERLILKKRRAEIVGRTIKDTDEATTTLLSFVRAKDKSNEKIKKMLEEESSSSSSDDDVKPEFISTFGGELETRDDEEEEDKGTTQGPELPSEQFRKILAMKKHAESPEPFEVTSSNGGGGTSRRNRRSRTRSRSRRRSRSRSRSRDRRRRSRSRHRSRSRSRRRSRSRDRRRSRSRDRRGYRRSRSRSRGKRGHSSSSHSSHSHRVSTTPLRGQEGGTPKREKDSDGAESMLDIRSSMSDSERERIEIENRKRRIRRTKRIVKTQGPPRNHRDSDSDDDKKEEARKLRLLMKMKIRKTEEKSRAEEAEKAKDVERGRRIREEELLLEEERRRQRDRERRDQERDRERERRDERDRDRDRNRENGRRGETREKDRRRRSRS